MNLARSHFRRKKVERKHAPTLADEPSVDPVDLGERDRLWTVLQSLPNDSARCSACSEGRMSVFRG